MVECVLHLERLVLSQLLRLLNHVQLAQTHFSRIKIKWRMLPPGISLNASLKLIALPFTLANFSFSGSGKIHLQSIREKGLDWTDKLSSNSYIRPRKGWLRYEIQLKQG